MRAFLILIFILFTAESWAVCFAPISRVNNTKGPRSDEFNGQLNAAYGRANELPGDCIVDGTIQSQQLADGSITTENFANATIAASKFAPGVIPAMGKPLRIRAFTAVGTSTWVKGVDVGRILVQVVGGGGGAGYNGTGMSTTAGTNSSFKGCVGGGSPAKTSGGASSKAPGGTATGGDINLPGGPGEGSSFKSCGSVNCYTMGGAGLSMFGHYGRGGIPSARVIFGGGGGAGYCAKLYQASELSGTETATVGAGGTATGGDNTGSQPGQAGIVLIYEYGK
jgi:hypothetical protein